MIERLENIFSELYIEYDKRNNENKGVIIQKHRSKNVKKDNKKKTKKK